MKDLKHIGFSSYTATKDGDVYSYKVDRVLKPALQGGYLSLSLKGDDGVLYNVKVHRLVAATYLDFDPVRPYVNHKDGDKTNNRLENLEYVSASENNIHANENGLRRPTHLTELNVVVDVDDVIHDWTKTGDSIELQEDAHTICRMLEEGYRVCDVSRVTGFDRRTIQHLRDDSRDKWKDITAQYNFDKVSRKLKTSPERVIEICKMLESGKSCADVYRDLGCDRKLVENIKNRKFHTGISSSYKF